MGYIQEIRKYVGHSPIMATAVVCIIYDKEKGILFEKSSNFGTWCVPGGALEIGESLEDGVKFPLNALPDNISPFQIGYIEKFVSKSVKGGL